MLVYECVPNVSDGRDRALLDACERAIVSTGVTLAHRTSDAIHHRSVFTFFGSGESVRAAALALARVTTRGIDLRFQRGAHPRIGALDVLPIVPFGAATMADAVALARAIASDLWESARVPSFFYGDAATVPARRLLADVRAGQFEGLIERGPHAGGYDVGDRVHASAGATAIGVRGPLVALNIVLATSDIAIAKSIAKTIRERDGGLQTLRSLGIALGDRVQVSCNLTDVRATPIHRVVGVVRELAAERGVEIQATELIGLVSRAALTDVAVHALGIEVPSSGAQ